MDSGRIEIAAADGPLGESVEIGYLTAWEDDPDTFDGWLSASDRPTDELIVNGASEAWARYRVLREFLLNRIRDIDTTDGSLTDRRADIVLRESRLLAAVAEDIEATLLAHARTD